MSSETDTFSYQGKTLSRESYLGSEEQGPLADQFVECSKCGARIHKFSVRCHECNTMFREIGKIDSGPRGSATKGITFVVGLLVLVLAAMALGQHAASTGQPVAVVILLGIAGVVLGGNGLLGVLYFQYFVGVKFLRGLVALGVGAASLLIGVVCLVLLI